MNEDTKKAFAAILANAQAKANVKSSATFAPKTEVKQKSNPIDVEKPKVEINSPAVVSLAKMASFTIVWQEGSGKFDGKVFNTWYTANNAMQSIYNEHSGKGYLKVKINVKWDNGAEITDRADCSDSDGDFCPQRETIGQYLKKQNSVMYASNLKAGDRVNLSFEDTYLTGDELRKANIDTFISSPNFINDIASDTEISDFTIDTLLADIKPESTELGKPQSKFDIVDYSDKSFAVRGETYPIRIKLREMGGTFNYHLKGGAGWIFSKSRYDAVKNYLEGEN